MLSSSHHWITACILVLTPNLPSSYLLIAASSGQIQTEPKLSTIEVINVETLVS